jgi:multidrug efflux pump subunit AcrA (membrane-fusion protein)
MSRAQWAAAVAMLAVTAVAVAMLLPPLLRTDQNASARARALPVAVMTLEAATGYTTEQEYTGRIAAHRASNVGFERGGRLVRIEVEEGDRVTLLQPLALLGTDLEESRHREMRAQLDAAEALLAELRAGTRSETLDAARAQVQDLEEQHALAVKRKERLEQLLAERAVSQDAADEAATQAQALRARLAAARAQRDELEAGVRTEQIAAQEAQVEGLRAALESIEVVLDQSWIYAPFDGVVTGRYADEGEVLAPGSPLVRIVKDAAMEARVAIPVTVAESLAIGQGHTVRAGGREYGATVASLLPEVDPATRSMTAVFRLDAGAYPVPVPGQPARVRIARHEDARGFWLPTTALTASTRGLWSCYAIATKEDGAHAVERREIEIVHVETERVLVRGILAEGDQVITEVLTEGDTIIRDGVHRVVPGQLVEPITRDRTNEDAILLDS